MTFYSNQELLERAKLVIKQLTSLDVDALGDNILTVGPIYKNGTEFYKFKRQIDKHDHYHVDSKTGYLYRIPFSPLNTNEEVRIKKGADSFVIPIQDTVLIYDIKNNISYVENLSTSQKTVQNDVLQPATTVKHKIEFETKPDGSILYLDSFLRIREGFLTGVFSSIDQETKELKISFQVFDIRNEDDFIDTTIIATTKEELIQKLNNQLK